MTVPLCDVFVPGEPVGQGPIRYGRSGHGYHPNGRQLRPWRELVGALALQDYRARGHQEPHDGPVILTLTFWLPRPASAKRPYPSVRPDLDHLERAAGDALTQAGVLADDSRACDLISRKRYAGDWLQSGVHVRVEKLAPPP